MAYTAHLALPLLDAGQAQKEMTVNESLQRLDLAVQSRVVAVGLNTPPSAPAEGQAWIVGIAPTGGWAGQAGALAGWTAGGWRFLAPGDGMRVWSIADGCETIRTAGAWRLGVLTGQRVEIGGIPVLGPQAPAIATPVGGSVVDAEARTSVAAILSMLSAHGLIATSVMIPCRS